MFGGLLRTSVVTLIVTLAHSPPPLTPSLQIHHALADMLSSVLSPLVRADQPHSCTHLPAPLLAEWYSLIFTMKTDVWSWMNKHAKHIQVGPGVGWGGKQAR